MDEREERERRRNRKIEKEKKNKIDVRERRRTRMLWTKVEKEKSGHKRGEEDMQEEYYLRIM